MKKNRIIPVLLLKNGWLVQSRKFKRHQNLGNPITAVKRFSEWTADELIYIDISRNEVYDIHRDDQGYPNRKSLLEIIEDVSKSAFMPINCGGKVRTLDDIEKRLSSGADKVTVNTQALLCKDFIFAAAKEFGSQCITVSIDTKKVNDDYLVYSDFGTRSTSYTAAHWAEVMEANGAGEILLNSIDRDGTSLGYDIPLLQLVSEVVDIPVIAVGGVGEWCHFSEALEKTNVDAVAAANIFHYSDQSIYLARQYLYDKGFNVREPDLMAF